MAVRFPGSGAYTRTVSLGTITQYSVTCWAKISTDTNTFAAFWGLDSGSGSDFGILSTGSDGTSAIFADETNGGTGPNMTVGTWYFFGVSVNGATGTLLYRAATSSAFTAVTWSGASANLNAAEFHIGGDVFTEPLNGCVAALKMWVGATLTQAEMENESWGYLPQRTNLLKAWYPFDRASTVDFSGQGQTLSGGSGTTTEDGPPITWSASPPIWVPAPTAVPATATPSAAAVVASLPSATVSTGSTVTPSALAAVASVPAPVPLTATVPAPGVVAAVVSIPTPPVLASSGTVPVGVVALAAALPTPTVAVDVTVSPAALAVAAVLPSPVILIPASATVAPGVLALAAALPSVTVETTPLPGASLTADGQVEFGDPSSPILLGMGTLFRVQKITGWDSASSVDNGNALRQRRHGARSGSKYAGQRIVTIELLLDAFGDPTLTATRVAELEAATPIDETGAEVPLTIRLYNGQTRLVYGAVIDRDIPDDEDYSAGGARAALQIACSDALRYGPQPNSRVITPAQTVLVTNAGNARVRPSVRFQGACTDPVIVNATTGRRLGFDVALTSGQWIDVDCNLGTARRETSASALGLIDDTSVTSPEAWWLQPGSNQLTFTCTSPDATARADLVWRHGYL